jgi:hypothetical protein
MQVFQLEHFTVESRKLFVLAHLHSLRSKRTQRSLRQMLQHAESTLMEFHLLCTLIFHKITRITYTVQVVQLALANQEL